MTTLTPKRLFDTLFVADELFEWSKDEETYTKDGCHSMKVKAIGLCENVFTLSDEIKQRDRIAYRGVCKRLSQSIKKISKVYPMRKNLIIAAFFGVNNAKLLLKVISKIRGI
jgi:hypothetical protein